MGARSRPAEGEEEKHKGWRVMEAEEAAKGEGARRRAEGNGLQSPGATCARRTRTTIRGEAGPPARRCVPQGKRHGRSVRATARDQLYVHARAAAWLHRRCLAGQTHPGL